MDRKLVAILSVVVMVAASFAFIISDDSDAEVSTPKTVHPVAGTPWVSKNALIYIDSLTMYFEDDPYDEVVKYVNGEITFDQLKTRCGYTESSARIPSIDYYEVNSYSGSGLNIVRDAKRSITILEVPEMFFTSDPQTDVIRYTDKEIGLTDLKAMHGYTEPTSVDPDTDYYHITYTGWNIVCNSYHNGDTGLQWDYNPDLSRYDIYNDYFAQDPYDEVVRFVNGEITADELRTKCGHMDSGSVVWNNPYYVVYRDNNKMTISHHTQRTVMAVRPNDSVEAFFTTDPFDNVVKYVNGQMNLTQFRALDGFKERSDLESGKSYYYVSISGGDLSYNDETGRWRTFDDIRRIPISPDYLFLDKGEYHIVITDTDLTHISVDGMVDDRYDYIDITDRKGAGDIKLKAQEAIFFSDSGSSSHSLDDTWREKSITFTIDPAPSEAQKKTEFDSTVKILSDKEWIRSITADSLTGEYYNNSGGYMFVSGSAEETAFLENVVNKGLIDASGYGSMSVDVTGQHIVVYKCRNSSSDLPTTLWLSSTEDDGYGGTRYLSNGFECRSEKMSVSDVKPFKFYANYDFSLAVKYDTTRIKAVVMMYPGFMGTTQYAVLESERLYDFHMVYSAEYELYAIPVTSSSATLTPTEIGIYTSNVGSSDDFGMMFAIVAIFLCVLAFGTLFYAGRRPRWNEMTGLPESGGELVQHEVPDDVPDKEIPEEPPAEGLSEEPPAE